jgi:hypothetical protein
MWGALIVHIFAFVWRGWQDTQPPVALSASRGNSGVE